MPIEAKDIEFLQKHGLTEMEHAISEFLKGRELSTDEAASYLGVKTDKARRILTKLEHKGIIQSKRDGRIKWTRR